MTSDLQQAFDSHSKPFVFLMFCMILWNYRTAYVRKLLKIIK